MLVRISGDTKAQIEPSLIYLRIKLFTIQYKVLRSALQGVAYRTGQKGCMDSLNIFKWLNEPLVIKALHNGKIGDIFIDNCTGHNLREEILGTSKKNRTNLHYFPPNTTELLRPYYALVIESLKAAWKKRWDNQNLNLIKSNACTELGQLPNPRKSFFLKMAADVVRDVNNMRDKDGIT